VLHALPGLGSGGAERMAANVVRTLDRERCEAGVISLLNPPFGTDPEETIAQDEIPVWHLGKRRSFDPRTFARLARALDRFGPHAGSAPSLDPQGLAQRAPSLDKDEGRS
jgi:hypothetical protein